MGNVKTIKADLIAKGRKFGIVVSRFNEFISARLLDGAIDTLNQHGVKDADISVVWVPGSFEIPMTAKRMTASGKYDAVICLGAIIRGETSHFDLIASEVAKGVAQVGMKSDIPCVFGVVTTDNLEQALDRAGSKSGNKGRDAAKTAIEMSNLYAEI
ncbi:MAG: 6,7-dimethyl-8-ribityllumazine synthase [Candidatus Omnitrophica bacterium]|nr:6,7-dimethyl-8-ribityllumazine synthase [Candidatus Omnitrophota bacterium]MBU1128855.1 6,7-dimethyl-8-ribityllumazine synthase [Candidatus Omnitrophota bacterium]MBU1785152.1 6,7-dimethyl-8-ribityllumazine synthase [Candidatus Omnitrophota bacterium]MBU1852155.1 6,7-dimethyl-8-ribityllumazine synthase [Candidatus Omnitrophota bacterium]